MMEELAELEGNLINLPGIEKVTPKSSPASSPDANQRPQAIVMKPTPDQLRSVSPENETKELARMLRYEEARMRDEVEKKGGFQEAQNKAREDRRAHDARLARHSESVAWREEKEKAFRERTKSTEAMLHAQQEVPPSPESESEARC